MAYLLAGSFPYFCAKLKNPKIIFSEKDFEDYSFSTRQMVRPKEFTSTHSASATIFLTLYSMTSSRRYRRRFIDCYKAHTMAKFKYAYDKGACKSGAFLN